MTEKNAGRAKIASRRMLWRSVILLFVILASGLIAKICSFILLGLALPVILVWALAAGFIFYFFRDPSPNIPTGEGLIVSPAHGTVDFIGEAEESDFLGKGPCKRVSIFLSVFDVHVQNAPITGTVSMMRHTPGQFMNAMNLASAGVNENVLFGFDAPDGRKLSVRLIAGLIARRIVPWVQPGESANRGERIALIQFGSRVDPYLPREAEIQVHIGDKVRGGETIMAKW